MIDREWITGNLRSSLQILAQSADVQCAYFPDFMVPGDELLLDFADSYDAYLSNFSSELNLDQLAALTDLNRYLDGRFDHREAEFYEYAGLSREALWAEARKLAVRALGVFDWPNEIPPPPDQLGTTYVPGR